MAERRMFAKTIIDSDAFLEMPLTSQALYFHLSMRADDEGFINNPKKIARMIGAADDDLRVLASRKFIIPFESGIVVIKHWRIHNYIQKDRFKATVYAEERSTLTVKENGAYTASDALDTECIQNGYSLDTQVRLESVNSKSKDNREAPRHLYGPYKNVLLSDSDLEKLKAEFADYGERIDRLSEYMASSGKTYRSHLATIRNWAKRDKERETEKKAAVKSAVHNFDERNTDYDALIGGFNV